MTIRGYPTQGKITDKVDGVLSELTDCRNEYATVQTTRSGKGAVDTITTGAALVASKAAETGCTARKIKCTGHGVSAGDLIRFTSGNNIYIEMNVKYVIDANYFVLDGKTPYVTANADTFDHLIYVTQTISTAGATNVNVVASVLPTGAATSANQVTGNNSLASLVTNTNALTSKQSIYRDCSGANITTLAWADLATSTAATKQVQITQNGGGYLYLRDEDAASSAVVPAGFSGTIPFAIPAGKKLQAEAIGADITSGKITINLLG